MLIITSDPRFEFWKFIQPKAAQAAKAIDPYDKHPEWFTDAETLYEASKGEDAARDGQAAMELRADTLEYLAANAAEFLDQLYFRIQGSCGAKDRVWVVKRTYALGARALAMRLDTAPELPPADDLRPEEAYRYATALMKSAVAEVDRVGGETAAFKTVLANLDAGDVQRWRAAWLPPGGELPLSPRDPTVREENAGEVAPWPDDDKATARWFKKHTDITADDLNGAASKNQIRSEKIPGGQNLYSKSDAKLRWPHKWEKPAAPEIRKKPKKP
jgi:hypothetical protein